MEAVQARSEFQEMAAKTPVLQFHRLVVPTILYQSISETSVRMLDAPCDSHWLDYQLGNDADAEDAGLLPVISASFDCTARTLSHANQLVSVFRYR